MDAYSRHKKMVNDYLNFYGGSMKDFERDKSTDRTDLDVVRDHNRFLWNDGEELGSWYTNLCVVRSTTLFSLLTLYF